jgi:hypothetical protein
MTGFRVEFSTAWAEDTALLGSNRSADPGAKTERRAMDSSLARLSSTPFGIGTQAINPSRRSREIWAVNCRETVSRTYVPREARFSISR